MSDVWQNLNDNLNRQVALYEELSEREKDKQQALIANNLPELNALIAREEQLILKANGLEKERLVWAEHIGRELGKAPEDLTLAELTDHFPMLEGVSQKLEWVVGGLQELHKTNALLLRQAMKVVDFTLGMLTHQASNTYTHPRRKENEGYVKLHLLDRRI
ncbi:MAG: flagellar protein FlgN [Desulfosporosinus sp.]|nr:flagellar protein FlgN [Desulfosporosinus sp.]